LAAAVLTIVGGLTMPVVLASRPAGADDVSDLQAQAAQLGQAILRQQLEMGGLQQQYSVAADKVQLLEASIGNTRTDIEHDEQQITVDLDHLRRASLFAYMTAGSAAGSSSSQVFAPSDRSAQAEAVYRNLVAGDVTVMLDQLSSDRARLRAREQTLQQEQAAAQDAQQSAAALLNQSQQVEGQLESEQSQVTGRLAVAIAQQQAAEAAAAAAAIRAAEEAAAEQAAAEQRAQAQQAASQTTVTQAPTVIAAPASTGSGPALNTFLQCALQAESGGDYTVVSSNGQYFGGFQFSQPAWDEAAQLAGQPSLVGVQPNTATPAQQNELAVALYGADGSSPWYDPCTGH
jgi:Transglycosylase-like domain